MLHGHGETRTAPCLHRGGVHTCERTCQPSSYAYLVGRPPSVSCVGAPRCVDLSFVVTVGEHPLDYQV